jgi:hypothetical protein
MRTEKFIRKWLYSISLFAVGAIMTTTYAQKPYLETGIHGHKEADIIRAITDTLDDHFDSATATIYASPNGGYVGGNSGYHESAKAQEFDVDAPDYYFVEGFIYWFGFKAMESLPSDSSYLNLKFWNNNYTAVVGSTTRQIPYSVFDSIPLLMDTLTADTMFAGGANVWMLSTPEYVTSNYSVGFSMEHLHYKDTISLMTSTDGDPPVSYMSWERWNGVWNVIEYAWGLDIDFAIFPLVDLTGIGIEEMPFVKGLRYNLYPNPATEWMNIDMDLQMEGEYTVTVHDLSGKFIKSQNLGYLSQGRVSTSVEVFELPSGVYILSLTNGKNGLSQRFIKN